MSDTLFSRSWYRVAGLQPRLRSHVELQRHTYRGELTYFLRNHSTGKYFRFNPAAYELIGRFDGKRTMQEIWEACADHLDEAAPSQEETIELLGQLHAADCLQMSVTPDCAELLRRYRRNRDSVWKRPLSNPLAVKVPLGDPDRLLEWLMPIVRPLFGWFGVCLWLTVVGSAAVLAAAKLPELAADARQYALSPLNLLLVWLCYPVVKLLHETGHGLAAKHRGGEVHEVGLNLLVLVPVPYVDASSAWSFRERRHRMLVGAAGIAVELFLAGLAFFVWVAVEPGLVRALALDVMLIGCVSTLLFNGNPLMRFDGYYVLKDWLEIPNLGSRSSGYLLYLIQRYGFGVREASNPATSRGERRWLLTYGIASTLYRVVLVTMIVFLVAGKFFVLGMIFAAWAATTMFLVPLGRAVAYLATSPQLRRCRGRAAGACAAAIGIGAILLGVVPVPSSTHAEGVVWLPDRALVRAGADGFVQAFAAEPDSVVGPGDALVETQNPVLQAELKTIEAELAELKARREALRYGERVKVGMVDEQIEAARAKLRRTRERAGELVARSRANGVFVVPERHELLGRFVRKGEELGYVLEPSAIIVRVVVPQGEIGLVRENVRRVDVKLAERLDQTLPGRVDRLVPSATDELPSAALGTVGGGRIPVNPTREDGRQALESVFQFDVELDVDGPAPRLGGRAYVRFDHGKEPLARQWFRIGRQLFLSHFQV